jgi:hypothetical protein
MTSEGSQGRWNWRDGASELGVGLGKGGGSSIVLMMLG